MITTRGVPPPLPGMIMITDSMGFFLPLQKQVYNILFIINIGVLSVAFEEVIRKELKILETHRNMIKNCFSSGLLERRNWFEQKKLEEFKQYISDNVKSHIFFYRAWHTSKFVHISKRTRQKKHNGVQGWTSTMMVMLSLCRKGKKCMYIERYNQELGPALTFWSHLLAFGWNI